MKYKWMEIARELQFIAQAGLTYSKDEYDLERFRRLREISAEIMADFTDTDMEKIVSLFAGETGYQTPKVDIRGAVIKDGRLLLVREKAIGRWSLPGGWADTGLTPSENVIKEVREESGLDVETRKIIAVWDKKNHRHPPSPFYTYKIVFHCGITGGTLSPGMETDDAGFFPPDALPELSLSRNTPEQIDYIFTHLMDPGQATCFD